MKRMRYVIPEIEMIKIETDKLMLEKSLIVNPDDQINPGGEDDIGAKPSPFIDEGEDWPNYND